MNDKIEQGKKIIEDMKRLRVKYYPNVEVDNFTQEDRELYVNLENQLNAIIDTDRGNLLGLAEYLTEESYNMIVSTSTSFPQFYQTDDSYDLDHKFTYIKQMAKGAADIEAEAIIHGDYEKLLACKEIKEKAYEAFSTDIWGSERM